MDPAVVSGRPDTDWDLPEIYKPFIDNQYSSVEALMHRYVVDLNRDPAGKPLYNDQRYISSIVPLQTFAGQNIYREEPTEELIKQRVEKYFWTHHKNLEAVLREENTKLMVDAHSIARQVPSLFDGDLPDVILGNGGPLETAPLSWLQKGGSILQDQGFSVSLNSPFRGGWITRTYPNAIKGLATIQIEMCNDLYLENGGQNNQTPTKKLNKNKVIKLQKALNALLQVWGELAI